MARIHEASYEKVFIFRTGSSHDTHLRFKSLEGIKVFDALFTVIRLACAVMRAVLLANSADKTIHSLVELGAFNANVIILLLSLSNDLALLSDSLGSDEIVSCNHADNDTSFLASLDSTWHFRSDDIVDTEDGNKSKSIALSVLLLSILDSTLLIRRFVVLITEVSRLKITVCDSDCAKRLLSVTLNDSINLRALVVSDLLSASIGGDRANRERSSGPFLSLQCLGHLFPCHTLTVN